MKYILIILIGCCSFHANGQANDSSDFQLEIKFEDTIPVQQLQAYYYYKRGNSMMEIFYELDTIKNSITLSGRNDYVLWVSFPMLVFTLTEEVKLHHSIEKVEKTTHFYLATEGPLSSYTGEQTTEMLLSYKDPIIVASLEYHNGANAFENLKLRKEVSLSRCSNYLYMSNEMIRINEHE